jgi:stringent starvation protein B
MSSPTSTKPYMMRAIYEWCIDNGYTPYLAVAVDANTRVPMGHVRDGEIVLNINYSATKDLLIGHDAITFSARFNGVANAIYVPVDAVRGIYARENGQGLFFDPVPPTDGTRVDGDAGLPPKANAPQKKPELRIVK